MGNLIIFPGAKTYLYNNPVNITKETIKEVINLVYDNISEMTGEQFKNLKKRLKIYDDLVKLLPPGKHKLLLKYEELNAAETDTVLEEAISFILKNENQINDVLASNY